MKAALEPAKPAFGEERSFFKEEPERLFNEPVTGTETERFGQKKFN